LVLTEVQWSDGMTAPTSKRLHRGRDALKKVREWFEFPECLAPHDLQSARRPQRQNRIGKRRQFRECV
jgi:hypothetical protein